MSVRETDLDLAAAILLERLVALSYRDKRSSSIQPLQWAILRYLNRDSEDAGSISALGSFLGLTHAPISRSVATLKKRGLIADRRNPKDLRSRILILTKKGYEVLADDPMNGLAGCIKALPREQRSNFLKSLNSIAMYHSSLKQ